MVNDKTPNIDILINLLKESEAALSGESLAETLGISRVAVWKLINKLKDDGYNIESGRQGYRLAGLTDKPLPRELERPAGNISYFDELGSTMQKAGILIENGCSDGTTIIAGRQSAGVSREGGRWSSPEGGLYFTRIRTTPMPAFLAGLYGTALASAAAEALRDMFGIEARLRWPNEVAVGGKKICGVLTRFGGELNRLHSVSAGIGVNANTPSADIPAGATSIRELTGRTVSMKQLLSGLLETIEEIDRLFSNHDNEQINLIIEECKANMETLGRSLSVKYGGNEITGTAVNIDSAGALIIETGGGELISIYSGEDYHYV